MATQANFLVFDDQATPVEHTLIPVSDNPCVWRGTNSALPMEGQIRVTFQLEQLKNGDFRASKKTEVPVLETIGTAGNANGYVAPPKVAHVTTHIETMFFSKRSTAADRANALKIALGITLGASSTTGTGFLTNTSAGGAYASNNKAGPQLFVAGVMPS
jgi:hypothetical protein